MDSLVPKALFDLTAILIKNKIIALEDIWPHLSLTDNGRNGNEPDEIESLLNE